MAMVDVKITADDSKWTDKDKDNDKLTSFKKSDKHFNAGTTGSKGIKRTLYNVAKDLKNIFFIIASIYLLIIVLRQLFSDNSEEAFWKFKKGVVWTTMWIIVMQVAYSFVDVGYWKNINWWLAFDLVKKVLNPLLLLIETIAALVFISIAVFSFYRMVTANGDEEKAKSWKTSVLYAIVWFIVVKFARTLVEATYSKIYCDSSVLSGFSCNQRYLSEGTGIIFNIINWMNGFVWIAVILMVIYIWSQIIFSHWEEEKIKTAKSSMIYVIIGVFVLIINYFILTFFSFDNINTSTWW